MNNEIIICTQQFPFNKIETLTREDAEIRVNKFLEYFNNLQGLNKESLEYCIARKISREITKVSPEKEGIDKAYRAMFHTFYGFKELFKDARAHDPANALPPDFMLKFAEEANDPIVNIDELKHHFSKLGIFWDYLDVDKIKENVESKFNLDGKKILYIKGAPGGGIEIVKYDKEVKKEKISNEFLKNKSISEVYSSLFNDSDSMPAIATFTEESHLVAIAPLRIIKNTKKSKWYNPKTWIK